MPGLTAALSPLYGGVVGNLYFANGAACTLVADAGWYAGLHYLGENGGTLAVTNSVGFQYSALVDAGATVTSLSGYSESGGVSIGGSVTTFTHLSLAAATVTGTLTTEIGLNIPKLTGTTHIGIQNADTTVFLASGSGTLTATSTITPSATVLNLQAAGNITFTSTPIIAAGAGGQYLVLVNSTAHTFTFTTNSSLAGSNLSLGSSTTRVVATGGSLSLSYQRRSWGVDRSRVQCGRP